MGRPGTPRHMIAVMIKKLLILAVLIALGAIAAKRLRGN
jgi:hypothetical protein